MSQAGGRRVLCTVFLYLRLLCKSFQVTFGDKIGLGEWAEHGTWQALSKHPVGYLAGQEEGVLQRKRTCPGP